MKLTDAQKTVRDLIAAHAVFAPVAATSVLVDLGHVRSALEKSIEDNGYCVGVWPPAQGATNESEQGAGVARLDGKIVVRLEVGPAKLAELRAAATGSELVWLNSLIAAVMSSVLGERPDAGGVSFRLADDAFELVNFDEGLAAWHFRFVRLVVAG